MSIETVYLSTSKAGDFWAVTTPRWRKGVRVFMPTDRATAAGATVGRWIRAHDAGHARRLQRAGALFLVPPGDFWRGRRDPPRRFHDFFTQRWAKGQERRQAERKAHRLLSQEIRQARERQVQQWREDWKRSRHIFGPLPGEKGYVPERLRNPQYRKLLKTIRVVQNSVFPANNRPPITYMTHALARRDAMERRRQKERSEAMKRGSGKPPRGAKRPRTRPTGRPQTHRRPFERPQTHPAATWAKPQTRPGPQEVQRRRFEQPQAHAVQTSAVLQTQSGPREVQRRRSEAPQTYAVSTWGAPPARPGLQGTQRHGPRQRLESLPELERKTPTPRSLPRPDGTEPRAKPDRPRRRTMDYPDPAKVSEQKPLPLGRDGTGIEGRRTWSD